MQAIDTAVDTAHVDEVDLERDDTADNVVQAG